MLEESYLRVRTPQTVDGLNLKYMPDGFTPMYSEAHLPLTARKHIDAQNANLPAQLRHLVELVSNDSAPVIPGKKKPGVKAKITENA